MKKSAHFPNFSSISDSKFIRNSIVATAVIFGLFSLSLISNSNQVRFAQAQEVQEVLPISLESVNNSLGLTAIPPRLGDDLSLLLQPGERTQVQLRVRNNSDTSIEIISLPIDFIISDNGEIPLPLVESDPLSNRWSLASWVAVAPNQQVIRPQETVGVNVLINVPDDALPGGKYAMIVHQPITPGNQSGQDNAEMLSATGISQQVGSLLYIIIDGPVNEAAYITNFQFANFSEFGPIPYNFSIDNQSDLHIKPQIGIEIYNMLGMKSDTIVVETKNIFPLSLRSFDGKWDRIWGFGRYTAKISASYGSGGQIAVDSTSFWILPIRLIVTIIILILTFIASLIAVRRHFFHRNSDERKRIELLEKRLIEMESEKLKKFED